MSDVDVALMAERLRLRLDEEQTPRDRVEATVKALGFGIAPKGAAIKRKGFVLPDGAFPAGPTAGTDVEQEAAQPAEGSSEGALRWYQTSKGRLVIGTGVLLAAAWVVKLSASVEIGCLPHPRGAPGGARDGI